MISLTNVTKDFNLGENVILTPVRNVSLEITEGEFIMIIGRSGSGKSTLLNLVAGLIKPTSGQIMINDQDIWNMTDKQLSVLRSRKLGYIFQFPSLLPALTVLENVAFPTIFGFKQKRQDAYQRAAKLLDMMGLSEKLEVYPKQLSAGEQKRVVVARSLINQPELILADEPTSDLDTQTEKELMGLLQEINKKGVTILMVTHSLQLAPHSSKVFRMEAGELFDITHMKERLSNGKYDLSNASVVKH